MASIFKISFAFLACILLQVAHAQSFELSENPLEFAWPAHDWNGKHSFPPVYCLTFPLAHEANRMTTAMFNRNAISHTRVIYPNDTALYVVTSVIPVGRTPEEDVSKMLLDNQRMATAAPNDVRVEKLTSGFGNTGALIIRNSTQSGPKAPFPVVRRIAKAPDGLLRSLSVHRLVARGPDRMEVAGLRYFRSPVTPEDEPKEIEALSSLVDNTLSAMYSCTDQMPIRHRN